MFTLSLSLSGSDTWLSISRNEFPLMPPIEIATSALLNAKKKYIYIYSGIKVR